MHRWLDTIANRRINEFGYAFSETSPICKVVTAELQSPSDLLRNASFIGCYGNQVGVAK